MNCLRLQRRTPFGILAAVALCALWVTGYWQTSAQSAEPAPVPVPADGAEAPLAKPPTKEEVNKMIDNLSSDDFAVREQAQKSLRESIVNEEIAEAIRQRYSSTDNPEVKLRLRRTLRTALQNGLFAPPKKAFLGIQMDDSIMIGGKTGTEMVLSVIVDAVIPGSAAETHGLETGDHIMEIQGKGFTTSPSLEFKERVGAFHAGDEVTLRLKRGGAEKVKKVKLGEMPTDLLYVDPTVEQLKFDTFFEKWLEDGGKIERP